MWYIFCNSDSGTESVSTQTALSTLKADILSIQDESCSQTASKEWFLDVHSCASSAGVSSSQCLTDVPVRCNGNSPSRILPNVAILALSKWWPSAAHIATHEVFWMDIPIHQPFHQPYLNNKWREPMIHAQPQPIEYQKGIAGKYLYLSRL